MSTARNGFSRISKFDVDLVIDKGREREKLAVKLETIPPGRVLELLFEVISQNIRDDGRAQTIYRDTNGYLALGVAGVCRPTGDNAPRQSIYVADHPFMIPTRCLSKP
jgi:hypothetical protein